MFQGYHVVPNSNLTVSKIHNFSLSVTDQDPGMAGIMISIPAPVIDDFGRDLFIKYSLVGLRIHLLETLNILIISHLFAYFSHNPNDI